MVLPMRMDAVPNNQTLTALPIQVVTAVQVLTFTVLPTPMVTAFQGPESHAQQEMEIPKSVLQSALSVIALVGCFMWATHTATVPPLSWSRHTVLPTPPWLPVLQAPPWLPVPLAPPCRLPVLCFLGNSLIESF